MVSPSCYLSSRSSCAFLYSLACFPGCFPNLIFGAAHVFANLEGTHLLHINCLAAPAECTSHCLTPAVSRNVPPCPVVSRRIPNECGFRVCFRSVLASVVYSASARNVFDDIQQGWSCDYLLSQVLLAKLHALIVGRGRVCDKIPEGTVGFSCAV